jgi:tRNA pseudouridine55 synthase
VSRRGATDIRGIMPIDKPAGMTSHDVVARVRRATGEGRVGHGGTLDPDATGLLVVLLGPYTRLEPYLSAAEKSYTARISFGAETDTDDASGEVLRSAPADAACFDPVHAAGILASFLGASLQTPPAYSAIKVNGRTAHRAARAGEAIELAPRPIQVYEAALTGIDPGLMTWDVDFRVSKGTYIRSLARDIGRACGSAAHLSGLRRTAAGTISLAQAVTLDEAVERIGEGGLASLLTDPVGALGLAVTEAPPGSTRSGASLPRELASHLSEGELTAVSVAGVFSGIYRADERALKPVVVFPEPPAA